MAYSSDVILSSKLKHNLWFNLELVDFWYFFEDNTHYVWKISDFEIDPNTQKATFYFNNNVQISKYIVTSSVYNILTSSKYFKHYDEINWTLVFNTKKWKEYTLPISDLSFMMSYNAHKVLSILYYN